MKEMKILNSCDFFSLLDNLLSQFLDNKSARCLGEELGKSISSDAKDYFSITVDHKEIKNDITMLGFLLDDFKFDKSRNGCTYSIFIDTMKIDGPLFQPFLTILLAHQICHFAFFYELFMKHASNKEINIHKKFLDDVISNKYMNKQDYINQHLIDVHNIPDLIKNMGEIKKEHFTRKLDSVINYDSFFFDFIEHMNTFYKMKNKY